MQINPAVELHTGDCLDVLAKMPSSSVDAVITDPPYNYSKDYGVHDDNMEWDEFAAWLTLRFKECARVLRDGGVIYFTCSPQMMTLVETWDFLRFRQWLIWHRPNLVNVHAHSDWKQTWEPIYYGGKGTFSAIKGVFPDSAVFTVPTPQSNFKEGRDHVCQRPVKLIRMILNRVDAELILDPFMGSGTTGVACIETGRRFIGIDIEPKYVEIARLRIAKARSQPVLPTWHQLGMIT